MKWKIICFVVLLITLINAETDLSGEEFEVVYSTPSAPGRAYLAETFDNLELVENNWIKSNSKKLDVEADISKYDGKWSVESAEKDALTGDLGLVLKSKAKHAAISAHLNRPFVFKDKPLIVQYEVNLQNGQDCGGSYIKLLSQPKKGEIDLGQFQDKTPYTIMFGPDKCGNDHKFHFIFRHVNPLNGSIEEKHCKQPKNKLEEPFKDKRPHLYTLIMRPDNSYEMLFDHENIMKGNLFEDFSPSINPPKEISDPNDSRPNDWDDREKISNPSASKPDDWDEDAPRQIKDDYAEKPEGWLEDEPKLISDPNAEKADDWDNEMDGEWVPPLIKNPRCEDATGCGIWKAPLIDNPNYKGKWRAPVIDNPNYAGKWAPRSIANPHFFEDLEPFKMTAIGAVGIEIWSMSDNIYFDNILITDDESEAKIFAAQTFDLKVFKIDKGEKGFIKRIVNYSNENPWVYAVYVLLLAVPAVLFFACCCSGETKERTDEGDRKKMDKLEEDDPHDDQEANEEQSNDDQEVNEEQSNDDQEVNEEQKNDDQEVNEEQKNDDQQVNEEQNNDDQSEEVQDANINLEESEKEQEELITRSSPRLRKPYRE